MRSIHVGVLTTFISSVITTHNKFVTSIDSNNLLAKSKESFLKQDSVTSIFVNLWQSHDTISKVGHSDQLILILLIS